MDKLMANAFSILGPASASLPATKDPTGSVGAIDLQAKAILDLAYKKLGEITAQIDLEQERQKQLYQQQLDQSRIDRKASSKRSQENDSARGLLDSGIALQNLADVGLAFDQKNAGYLKSFDDTMTDLARRRLAAQSDYATAQIDYQKSLAQKNAQVNIENPALAEQVAANANPDPFNWGAIDAALKAQQASKPSYKPAVKPILAKPKPVLPKAKPKPVLPKIPKIGAY